MVLTAWISALTVLAALAVDRWLGEPLVRWHPVVWIGNYLGWAGRALQAYTLQVPSVSPDLKAFWLGALVWIGGGALVFVAYMGLQTGAVWIAGTVGWVGSAVLLGLLLKPLLAWSMLKGEVHAVEQALSNADTGSLEADRERLRWLVSRDVTALSETQVRESAIETLAENLNDSVIAPLFRFANTADAMWGYPGVYQGRNWAWAGKWVARADDVLAWVPARLTALLLVLVSGGGGGKGARGMTRLRCEAARTPSPNSGWPMAAMALALGVRLGKPGGYVLNGEARAPVPQDTLRAINISSKSLLDLVFIAQAAIVLIVMAGVPCTA